MSSTTTKTEFLSLELSGNNYLPWTIDAEILLTSKDLEDSIVAENKTSKADKARALVIFRKHMQEELEQEYLIVKDPEKLWAQLEKRFDHQGALCKPLARQEWMNLRFQDCTSVTTYNSALHNITSRLMLCGVEVTDEDKIERTLSIFPLSQVTMQRAYRNQAFTEYSELISLLLVSEQNDQVLLRNHAARPTGAMPRPEANHVSDPKERTRRGGRGKRGRGGQSSGKQPYEKRGRGP